jgi:Lar family restriction alleviation protein
MFKLKPCPFCGDISLYVSDGDCYSGYESYGFRVSCRCHYAWKVVPWCKTKEEAIDTWNRRVSDD